MEKGWIVEVSQSEADFSDAYEMAKRRLEMLLEEKKRLLERRDYWYQTNSKLKREHRNRKHLIDFQLNEIAGAQYRPWSPAYPFRPMPIPGLQILWDDVWVQGKLYDIMKLPVTTTALDRCVELLKDLRHVYKERRSLRIYHIETREEIPCDFIIEA